MPQVCVRGAVADLCHECRSGERDLVEPVVATNDEGVPRAESAQRLPQVFDQIAPTDTE